MQDKRRYVRMGTVFPVEFTVDGPGGNGSPERLLQGFTCNVSEGGMCIEFKSFGKETEKKLNADAWLRLVINPSFSREPIHARARIIWLKKQDSSLPSKYLIGVAYESIDPAARKRLISYARRMRLIPRLTALVGIAMLLALAVFALHTQNLTRENLRLADQLRADAAKRSEIAGELVSLSDERRSLETELGQLREANEREASIRSKLEKVLLEQERLRGAYEAMEKAGREDSKTALRWMSQWLSSHQNVKTGLVASFEGDPALEDVAFTYDQALASQVFLLMGESKKAQAILSFYDVRGRQEDGAYANAYESSSGQPHELVTHVGPNIWLGIAALQYRHFSGDERFMPMARRLADWTARLQDEEGGVPGGPGIRWYSTEHNLDAYAFLGMLADATGQEKYRAQQRKVLSWLKKYAYSNKGQAVNRGKGDATIATDTFAWSVAALGPAKLLEIGMDPEGILEFAQKNCALSVDFQRPDGQTVKVSGFDFAKARNLGRGGVVSTEWTAQMIVTYQVLARYFRLAGEMSGASRYLEKAGFYRSELQKMIITSPSRTGQGRGCLPYASADNVDTGHGWRTPQGSRTGSVAGTAYGLFAWKGYNPFELGGGPDAGLS